MGSVGLSVVQAQCHCVMAGVVANVHVRVDVRGSSLDRCGQFAQDGIGVGARCPATHLTERPPRRWMYSLVTLGSAGCGQTLGPAFDAAAAAFMTIQNSTTHGVKMMRFMRTGFSI